MQLEINNKQAGLDEDVFRKVKRLLRFSLSSSPGGGVSRAKVLFCDINGPKGGVDKRCRVTAKLRTSGQVVVQSEGTDCVDALCNCLDRLIRAVRREIDSRRTESIRINRSQVGFFDDQFEVEQL